MGFDEVEEVLAVQRVDTTAGVGFRCGGDEGEGGCGVARGELPPLV